MGSRSIVVLVVTGLAVGTLGGCRSAPRSADSGSPAVATAGWESPSTPTAAIPESSQTVWPAPAAAPAAAGKDDMADLRAANRHLVDQVTDLRKQVEEMKESRTGAEAPAESGAPAPAGASKPVPEPAPAVTLASVQKALRAAGVGELTASTNGSGQIVLTLPGTHSFGPGKAELSAASRETLLKLGAVLKRDLPDVRIQVAGHTDSDPIRKSSWASNEALSKARAEAVARVLVTSGGVAADRIESKGYGATHPVATNETSTGKAQNRRVEIVLLP